MIKYNININKGIWHVSFYVKNIDGKRKQKQLSTGFKAFDKKGRQINKRKAEEKAAEIVSQFEDLTESDCVKWTLDRYVADWLERNKPRLSITTYDKYLNILSKHIKPYFSEQKLTIRDIKPVHLERYCKVKSEEELSPTTILKHIGLIQPALKDAVKNGYIRSNPVDLMTKPKRDKPKTNFYNAEQLDTLLHSVIGTPIEVPVILAVTLGLRRSEIIGLRWSAIDFDNKILSINQKAVSGMIDSKSKTVISSDLKTNESESKFRLNNDLCYYLQSVRQKQSDYIRETDEYIDYVWIDEVGNLLKPDYITSKFRKILKNSSLSPIRFHDLRHSCISLLANNSRFSMKQVQDYARHANFLTTANIYSHTDIDIKELELNSITENFRDIFNKDSEHKK